MVGEAAFPINDSEESPGEGVLLTPAGLDQVRGSDGFASLLLEYPPGADAERLERELGEDYGLFFSAYSRPNLPGDVSNLDGARGVTVALGAFFAVLAVVGLADGLASSSRRRRVDFAVLRALGFHRGQVRRAVVVQALVITALGLTVGVPVGLVAGRVAEWRPTTPASAISSTAPPPAGCPALSDGLAPGRCCSSSTVSPATAPFAGRSPLPRAQPRNGKCPPLLRASLRAGWRPLVGPGAAHRGGRWRDAHRGRGLQADRVLRVPSLCSGRHERAGTSWSNPDDGYGRARLHFFQDRR